MTTTIKDVAARAGLSVMTVSRVLNGERHVSAEAKAKVEAAIEALGYRRNVFARGLPGSRSFLLCMLIPEMIPAYAAEFQQGAVEYCRAKGYHLVVQPYRANDEAAADAVATALASVRPDGFLLTPPLTDHTPVLEALERAKVAYVRLAPTFDVERTSSIALDEVEAARQMTLALLDLGHRRIGFIGGPADHGASQWRLAGYRKALEERELALDPALVADGLFLFESGEAGGASLLRLPDRPTAIFAGNDETALGVMAAAHRLGLSIPGDLSVAGFDDSEIAQLAWPQLTTVRQPIQAMAAAAAELVIAMAAARMPKIEHRRLPFELVFRGSTAPPKVLA